MSRARRVAALLLSCASCLATSRAMAQHVPAARHVASAVVGESRLELLAYDDGTVTAGGGSTMTSALARWQGDALRAWLDTAKQVMSFVPDSGAGDLSVATPIDGLWLVRQITARRSTYVLSVISPASSAVLDAVPSAAQVQTLLKGLGRADSVMRALTPDSLLRAGPADRAP